jgi:hypothetical protein
MPQNIHREANQARISNHRHHRNNVENGLPGTDVLRTRWNRALVELIVSKRTHKHTTTDKKENKNIPR